MPKKFIRRNFDPRDLARPPAQPTSDREGVAVDSVDSLREKQMAMRGLVNIQVFIMSITPIQGER